MKKYTFICEFRGGTYISQYYAQNVTMALKLWGENLTYPKLTIKEKSILNQEIDNPTWAPIALVGVDNVWCSTFTIIRSFLLLNIVETAK